MYIQVDVDIDEVLSEAGDSDIKDEAENRGFYVFDEDPAKEKDINFRRFICDKFGLNYHTPSNELLTIIAKHL